MDAFAGLTLKLKYLFFKLLNPAGLQVQGQLGQTGGTDSMEKFVNLIAELVISSFAPYGHLTCTV